MDDEKKKEVIRKFYNSFGAQTISENSDDKGIEAMSKLADENELEILELICQNTQTIKKHKICDELLENIANSLGGTDFLKELTETSINFEKDEMEHLTNGVIWQYLASTLDPILENKYSYKIPVPYNIPPHAELALKTQGSLIFRLYIALVYMREGPMTKIINEAAKNRKPISQICKKLLSCDYVRHLRNSLAHSTFKSNSFGIHFKDEDKFQVIVPTSFLTKLTTWMMILSLQCSLISNSK